MACTRLRLDFSLNTREERTNFLHKYLESETFVQNPPNEEELEMMGKYLLWGKNEKTGKTAKEEGLHLETRHGTWDDSPVDSLDQLLEQPTFSETQISALGTTHFRTKKQTFSREEALAKCPDDLREQLLLLFRHIDELELQIGFYELKHGKRKKELRPELLRKFTEEEQCTMREKIEHWNQYRYLNKRHELVELRREQYTLRDSFVKTSFSQSTEQFTPNEDFDFDAGIEVLPLGIKHNSPISSLVFRTWRELVPGTISQEDEKLISDLYWQKQTFNKKLQSAPSTHNFYFDFRELEHVYQLLDQQLSLAELVPEQEMDSNLNSLLSTLQFYIDQAELTDVQREILDMKLHKKKNADIAWDINHKYGKTYTINYISTIFKQRIIPRINAAATYHEKVIGNIFFPEEFKTCCHCGETMLRDPINFTRKSRATDGFSSRCKKCEKEARTGG